jgi:uncharacterized protein
MFEYDPDKSMANKAKHGIDFEEAQVIWDDERRALLKAHWPGEQRWLMIGKIDARHWTAVFTLRDATARIISVRRARLKEVEIYEASES